MTRCPYNMHGVRHFNGIFYPCRRRKLANSQTGEFILEAAEELLKMRETLTRVYVQRIGKPLWVVSKDMERDVFMSATERQAYGIVDLVAKIRASVSAHRDRGSEKRNFRHFWITRINEVIRKRRVSFSYSRLIHDLSKRLFLLNCK
ncbi:hypothetical protein M9H77_29395 [Catharanthus roseus]|uniref:Uncharacterized protein n=1 Tax=Catharanthus roseus TaxID=4058 RepID=A0ACB9ZYJ4_CATRO|nr:hypothetical protein M9H77_29395 [Catharanthus roseus]